jgi:hypothetical protein
MTEPYELKIGEHEIMSMDIIYDPIPSNQINNFNSNWKNSNTPQNNMENIQNSQ